MKSNQINSANNIQKNMNNMILNNNMNNQMSNNMNNQMSNNMNNQMINNMNNQMNNNMNNQMSNISNQINNNMNNNMNNQMNNNMMNNQMNNNMMNNQMSAINNMNNNINNQMNNVNCQINNSQMNNNMRNSLSNNMNQNSNNFNFNNNMNNNGSLNTLNNNMSQNNNINNQNLLYAKIAIQALNVLTKFKHNFFIVDDSDTNRIKNLTNSVKFLFQGLFSNEKYFQDIMNIYSSQMQSNNKNQIPDPYCFIINFIELLKVENKKNLLNPPNQQQINQLWMNERYDLSLAFNSYIKYIINFERSNISDNLYYTQLDIYNCNNCRNYFYFSLLPMIEVDIGKFASIGSIKYNLKTYLDNHFDNHQEQCKTCQSQAYVQHRIFNTSDILMIHLYNNQKMQNNTFEVIPDININIDNYIYKSNISDPCKEYVLKAYISFDQQIGYFVVYNFKIKNDAFIWTRFYNNKYEQITDQQINNCKPFLLFYEAKYEKKRKKNEAKNANNVIQNTPNNQNMQIQNYQQVNQNQNINNVNNMNMNFQRNMNNNFNSNSMGMNQFLHRNMTMNNNFNGNMTNNMNNNRNMMINMNMMGNMGQMPHINQMNPAMMQMQMQQNMMKMVNPCLIPPSGNVQVANPPQNTQSAHAEVNDENNIMISMILVSENNQDDETEFIKMQIKKDEKMTEIFKRYYTKLLKDENYIKKFTFNGTEISKTSTQKASELNIVADSKVKAIKNE